MVGAKHNAAPRNFDLRKYRTGDMPRIHVSGMRRDASHSGDLFAFARKVRVDVSTQLLRFGWVKTSGNSRFTHDGHDYLLMRALQQLHPSKGLETRQHSARESTPRRA